MCVESASEHKFLGEKIYPSGVKSYVSVVVIACVHGCSYVLRLMLIITTL